MTKMDRNILGMVLLMASTTASAQVALPTTEKATYTRSLSGQWDFKYIAGSSAGSDSLFFMPEYDTGAWKTIKVPGNWELQGFAGMTYGKKVRAGLGLYRRTIDIPAEWDGRGIYLCLEGVNFGYTLYVDGHEAGSFNSSYNRQTFDITRFAQPGHTHTLAVRVDTRPRGFEFDTNDDWSLSGISRDVLLFALPKVHIDDITIHTSMDGRVDIEALVAGKGKKDKTVIEGEITDAEGNRVASLASAATTSARHRAAAGVPQPHLWTAETPYLYTVSLRLKLNGQTVQTYNGKVGIREIAWDGGIYRINGRPVKFHGATHHDLSPVNGRSITDEEMKRDLQMMKDANMNFLRTSHYPPAPRLLELCDSIGMYVMCEVPFGFGESNLKDSTFLDDLKNRARLTLRRDKNHPSVVVWSVGNENPVTDIGLKTGLYVASLDSTRPFTFPMTPSVYKDWAEGHKAFDRANGFNSRNTPYIVSPHYPRPSEVTAFAKMYDRPMVATEYAHALGTDFGQMQDIYEVMATTPGILGGSVWEFFDQGILVDTDKKPTPGSKFADYVWPTPGSYYDTSGNQGTDGMTYADRTPQTDYYQARKVYSNIIIREAPLRVLNRFDFTNLSDIDFGWQLMGDGKELASGKLDVECAPHDSTLLSLSPRVPQPLSASKYWISITAKDRQGRQIYEKSVRLCPDGAPGLAQRIGGEPEGRTKVKKGVVTAPGYTFDGNTLSLKNAEGVEIISDMALARIGRKPTLASTATQASRRSSKLHSLWPAYMPGKTVTTVEANNRKGCTARVRFDCDSTRYIDGTVAIEHKPGGIIGYTFDLTAHGNGETVEAGAALMLPKELTNMRYMGNGPYAAYPGRDMLSEYGLWSITSGDLYYPGNRQHVDIALFTDDDGNGFAIVADDADIAVENHDRGIVVGINTHVASAYNKYEWPAGMTETDGLRMKGSFDIIPLTGRWNEATRAIFGQPDGEIPTFMPFYHAYDL